MMILFWRKTLWKVKFLQRKTKFLTSKKKRSIIKWVIIGCVCAFAIACASYSSFIFTRNWLDDKYQSEIEQKDEEYRELEEQYEEEERQRQEQEEQEERERQEQEAEEERNRKYSVVINADGCNVKEVIKLKKVIHIVVKLFHQIQINMSMFSLSKWMVENLKKMLITVLVMIH